MFLYILLLYILKNVCFSKMSNHPLSDEDFTILKNGLISETSSAEKKFEILYYSRGYFNANQVRLNLILKCFKLNFFRLLQFCHVLTVRLEELKL